MLRLLRCRTFRRPVTLLGAACTGAFVGFFVLDRYLLNGVACLASCAANQCLAYERLQRYEAGGIVQHPVVKSFDVNFLGSNSPIEDRFVVGISQRLGVALFSVIDGHKGYHCSHHLQKHILQYVTSKLHSEAALTGAHDLRILLDMNTTVQQMQVKNGGAEGESVHVPPLLSESVIEKCLRESFVSLDQDISNEAVSDIQLVLQGHSFTADMKERVMRAIDGACALVSSVTQEGISVASTGDCRAVLGRKLPDDTWTAVPLTVDQNAEHPGEVERIKREHPGEENTVIIANRVLGSLMPFRTFGDVDFKWERKYLEGIVPLWPNYKTPPYITAEPVVSQHKLQHGDKFVILASDGLWERMSNEEAVNIVAKTIKDDAWFLTTLFRKTADKCCRRNAATDLLWNSLGGTEKTVADLLSVDSKYSRMFRDDITVIVVFFKENK